jgi:hypothetical protein
MKYIENIPERKYEQINKPNNKKTESVHLDPST